MVKGNPDRKAGSNNPSRNNAIGRRGRIAFFVVVTVAIFASTAIIIMQVNEVSSTKIVRIPYFLSIANPSKLEESMFLNVELESNGGFMAAQHDITVRAGLYPDHRLRTEEGYGYSDLPSTYILIFEGTDCSENSQKFVIIGSTTDACSVELKMEPVNAIAENPNAVNFIGEGKIRYAVGGQFGLLLGTNFNENIGTANVIASESKFANIASFEVARELQLSEKTLYMAIPLAIIGAALSLIPLFFGRESG